MEKKRKQITLYLYTRCENEVSDIDHTVVRTYKKELAEIYFLDEGKEGFRYNVCWDGYAWSEPTFETEMEALRFICEVTGLKEQYETIRLRYGFRYGDYTNSEWGAVTWRDDIEQLNLAQAA